MLIFLDTAFTDTSHAGLIALALVTETGDELYMEFTDYAQSQSSAFVREAVEPLLGRTANAVPVTQSTGGAHVRKFIGQYPGATIACKNNIDWWLLTELLAVQEPLELRAENVQPQIDELRRQHYYVQHRALRNHALHDARACRYAYTKKT